MFGICLGLVFGGFWGWVLCELWFGYAFCLVGGCWLCFEIVFFWLALTILSCWLVDWIWVVCAYDFACLRWLLWFCDFDFSLFSC